MKPGSVSSALRQPPPTVSLASYSVTLRPARAMRSAATSPFGPPPTTTASTASALIVGRPAVRASDQTRCASGHSTTTRAGPPSGSFERHHGDDAVTGLDLVLGE